MSSQHFQERIAERLDVVDQLRRQVFVHPAGSKIGRVHARARRPLVEHHQLLAFLEAPERRRQRAHVERLRRDVQQMIEDAADLAIEHADQLPAPRHLDAQELLDRKAEGVLLVHRRDVVEPVEIRDRLQVRLVLDQLLGAPVQQPDVRVHALHDLAVELEDEAQHAVRRRMLRPEIDLEIAQRRFGHHAAPAVARARFAFSATRSLNLS